MKANPPFPATARPRAADACIQPLRRHALGFAALALITGSAWHVPFVAPSAAAAPQRVSAASVAPLKPTHRHGSPATVGVTQDPQQDGDAQDAGDASPPEPQLEQIPVVAPDEPFVLDT